MGSWWTSLCARCFYNTTPAVFPKAAAAVDANMFSWRLRFLSLYQHRPQAGQRDTRERHSETRYLLQDFVEDTVGFCQRCWKIIVGTCSSNLFRSELRNSTGISASFLNVHETDRCMQDFMHAFFGSETLQVTCLGNKVNEMVPARCYAWGVLQNLFWRSALNLPIFVADSYVCPKVAVLFLSCPTLLFGLWRRMGNTSPRLEVR